MDYEQIRYEERGAAALITLNRPAKLNAWTVRMYAEQADAIERANGDPAIGAIVMTGEGRAFCAGADIEDTFNSRIQESEASTAKPAHSPETEWVPLIRRSKPIVAAVNGPAIGVGCSMILCFDTIVASEAARFGLFFVKMGVVPELASSHFLPARVGFGRASELCLSGRMVEAAEAGAIGLADQVVPADRLLDTALDVAGRFAANPDRQLRMIKALLTQNAAEADLGQVLRRENEKLAECYASPEHKEAVAAFLEKRPPRFR